MQLDGRSDLYATGVLAFEMLTGRIPFEGRTRGEKLPETLEIVIARALAQKPGDRFQSMDELGAAFASVTLPS